MRLPRLLSGGAVVAVLVSTAACGLQTLEPKLELRDAADAFSSSRTTSLRLSLPSSPADVKAFTTEAGAESPPDDSTTVTSSSQPSDADLQQLLSSHVDVAYDKGADAKGSADDSARVLLHIGKTDAGEVRSVAGMVYARVDLTGLEGEFPDMKDGVLKGGGVDANDPALDPFIKRVEYYSMNFDQVDHYAGLKNKLAEMDGKFNTKGNRLFYLAVAPEYFSDIVNFLGQQGIKHCYPIATCQVIVAGACCNNLW